MRCYACGKTMKKKNVACYHYRESGLPNVYLKNIIVFSCSCGEKGWEIPRILELHQQIAEAIVDLSPLLNGQEIRFLRKHLELQANELARVLGVSKVTVSRWENNKVKIDKAYDAILRSLIKNREMLAVLENISAPRRKSNRRTRRYVINVKAADVSCVSQAC